MVAMSMCKMRIRITFLLAHLVDGVLLGGVEESGESCGRMYFVV
jgi:hypothetical protein